VRCSSLSVTCHLITVQASRSNAQRKGLVPAIGSLNTHIKGNPSLGSLPELELPPSPALPAQQHSSFTPFEVDPENLQPGVTQDLSVVEDVWRLRADKNAQAPDPSLLSPRARAASASGGSGFDVLPVLKVTAHVIRLVRNYLLSLPDEQGISRSQPRQDFRPDSLSRASRRSSASPQTRAVLTHSRGSSARSAFGRSVRRGQRPQLAFARRVASPTELSNMPTDASFLVSVMCMGGRRE